MSLKRVVAMLVVAFALLGSGCASVPMASPEEDTAAKQFSVPPGKARVYVYRNETMGAAITMPLSLNKRMMGKTGPKTYFMWDVEPGQHTIVSHTENDSKLDLNAEAGKVYFVWQEVKMGAFAARSALQLVDAATGKSGVQECKLAKPL